ncbi:MAG: hypothetical protein WCG06_01170 [Candidatus Omnitrophota bacterium]
MKTTLLAVTIIGTFVLAGCETGRNYQAESDSLNTKVSALQTQLSAKDNEIAKLKAQQGQLGLKDEQLSTLKRQLADQEAQGIRAEQERAMLSRKLDEAAAKLAARQQAAVSDNSDLK